MKWQAIAGITNGINEEAKAYLDRKLQKDAAVELPHVWSGFITETGKHLHASESNLEVVSNDKTGGLSCHTQFNELHEDFAETNKPFLEYILGKYDKRASSYLAGVKNPYSKRLLQEKIGSYRMHLAGQVTHAEVKLIDGKRHYMAVEAIEKLKKVTYDQPALYVDNLQNGFNAINSLSLPPQEKDKFWKSTNEELSYSAALGTIKTNPEVMLDLNNKAPWMAGLSFEDRVRLEHQATSTLHHRQQMIRTQAKHLSHSHFQSLLHTGKGIAAFENLLATAFAEDDPELKELKREEKLHREAFLCLQKIKELPLAEGGILLKNIAPKGGEIDYADRYRIHQILITEHDRHIKLAKEDPARLVEELFTESFADDSEQQIPFEQRLQGRKQLQEQKGIPFYGQQYLMKSELSEYLAILQQPDAGAIKQKLDSIGAIGGKDYALGKELLAEVLQNLKGEGRGRLDALSRQYVEAYLEQNQGLMDDLGKAIAEQGTLFRSFADNDKNIIEKTLNESSIMQDFEYRMKNGTPDNGRLVEQERESIKNLARFYQHQRKLEPAKATKEAINEIISKRYIKPLPDLYLPKSIIENGRWVELNEEYLEPNLKNLRADLIHNRLPPEVSYDKTHSFGASYDDERQQVLDRRIKEVLREGSFKLTPDHRHIYFVYFDDGHRAHNLLRRDGSLWHIPLSSLNMPPTEEQRLRYDMEEMHELLKKIPLGRR